MEMSPKGLGIMTFTAVSVAQFSLTVDAAQTIRTVLDSEDTVRGELLHQALRFATLKAPVSVAAADMPLDSDADAVAVEVTGVRIDDVLEKLATAGYVVVKQVWSEDSDSAYLDQARTVTAVHVLRPFTLCTTDPSGRHDRTQAFPAGWYLLGAVGDHTPTVVRVAAVEGDDAESLGDWLVEQEGFLASTCTAGCDTCGNQWTAQAGEWTFAPEEGNSTLVWAFEDAKDVDEQRNTIACPACAVGRVGFHIY